MVGHTKIQEEIESDVVNFMICHRTKGLDLITSLITLGVILKKIDRISIIRHLEIRKVNKVKRIRNRKN